MQTNDMHRYLLGFYKKGNMRFISHLDLQRLFKRCIKRAGIEVAYSNGFNPHEKINIVHPLSLGFETDRDYFESFPSGRHQIYVLPRDSAFFEEFILYCGIQPLRGGFTVFTES